MLYFDGIPITVIWATPTHIFIRPMDRSSAPREISPDLWESLKREKRIIAKEN